jgi:hypothetical protein
MEDADFYSPDSLPEYLWKQRKAKKENAPRRSFDVLSEKDHLFFHVLPSASASSAGQAKARIKAIRDTFAKTFRAVWIMVRTMMPSVR